MTHPRSLRLGHSAPQSMAPASCVTPCPWAGTSLREGRTEQHCGTPKGPRPASSARTGNSWDGPTVNHTQGQLLPLTTHRCSSVLLPFQIPLRCSKSLGSGWTGEANFHCPACRKGSGTASLPHPLLSTSVCNELPHGFRDTNRELIVTVRTVLFTLRTNKNFQSFHGKSRGLPDHKEGRTWPTWDLPGDRKLIVSHLCLWWLAKKPPCKQRQAGTVCWDFHLCQKERSQSPDPFPKVLSGCGSCTVTTDWAVTGWSGKPEMFYIFCLTCSPFTRLRLGTVFLLVFLLCFGEKQVWGWHSALQFQYYAHKFNYLIPLSIG